MIQSAAAACSTLSSAFHCGVSRSSSRYRRRLRWSAIRRMPRFAMLKRMSSIVRVSWGPWPFSFDWFLSSASAVFGSLDGWSAPAAGPCSGRALAAC